MEMIFIKPNDGRNVRLEDGRLLPKEGQEVPRTGYIDRRILSGDAVVVDYPSDEPENE